MENVKEKYKERKYMILRGKIKQFIIKFMYYFFPKRKAHELLYYMQTKQKINLKDPKNFNEKIHWLIVNEYDKNYAKYVNKIEVRKYIEEKGYGSILTKLYGTYENANEINFDELPDQFVLKTNHDSGNVFICTDKKDFDMEMCKKVLNERLKKNFACEVLEYQYKYIKPKIMCEEYIKEERMINPLDYKIHCFGRKSRIYRIMFK